jgi:hypothetical protein
MPNVGPIELLFILLLLAGTAMVAFLATRSNRPLGDRQRHEYDTEPVNPMYCPRCETELEYVGTKKFHEGTRGWGFALGDLGELFVNRESFDIYVCGRCGRVELFVDGIGEQFRPH